ncbi:ATP-binding cassette domain-containing protein, partial [Mycobacterium tuberculosis]|nr:ATP-binding cassette domain-containing protein [Mycobacterium tuberculosis]
TERVGLVGRNGVGKSTLVHLIAGELTPLAGSVAVTGRIGLLRQGEPAADGASIADLFGAGPALALLRAAERGAATAEELAAADWTLE